MTRAAVLAAVAVAAALAPAQPPRAAAPALPPGVTAFAALDVAAVWDHKALAPAREARGKLEFAWAVQSLVGLAPAALDRVVLFWHPSAPDLPFAAVSGKKAVDPAAVAKTLSRAGAAPAKAVGKAVPVVGSDFAFVYPVDAKTVLLAPTGADAAGLTKVAALLPALRTAAGTHALTVGVDVAAFRGLPIPVGGPLLDATTAVLAVDFARETATARLAAAYPTPAAATAAAPILKAKFAELAGYARAEQKKAEARLAGANAYPAPLLELAAATLAGAKVTAAGATLTGTTEVKLEEAVARVMMALPDAAMAARGPSAAENNLRQIGIACHAFHDANNHFPGNVCAKDGTPLLSWRVLILPYLEQAQVFQRFKMDEAWDSPANKAASETVVRTFQVPGRPTAQPWQTYFRVFTSPKGAGDQRAWLTDGEAKGATFANVTDGLSNTFMVVEAADAVPWAKPDDLPYDGKLPLPRLGGPAGTFAVVFGDGSTRTFRRGAFDEVNLRRCISIADGHPVVIPDR